MAVGPRLALVVLRVVALAAARAVALGVVLGVVVLALAVALLALARLALGAAGVDARGRRAVRAAGLCRTRRAAALTALGLGRLCAVAVARLVVNRPVDGHS